MKKTQETPRNKDNTKQAVLHMAFELSDTKWKLAFSDCRKRRLVSINARNLEQLQEEIEKAKLRFKLSDDVGIISCYEAGRDGFWLHRYLLSCGVLCCNHLSIRSAFFCNLSICFSLHTVYIHLLDFEYDLTCLG